MVTLLATEIRDRGYGPLVIDADESNAMLYRMLGFQQPPLPLVELAGELAKRGVALAGSIPYEPEVFAANLEGHPLAKGSAASEMGKIVDSLLAIKNVRARRPPR